MCGIAGFCDYHRDFTAEPEYWQSILVAQRMAVRRRGGDGAGEYLCENAGLAHARLAIRDPALGIQPMVRTVEGAEFAVCYNGEIYNTDEIRPALEKVGYGFQTTSDTEVLLFAYIHYGIDFVNRLNGIFAFAIWDGRNRCLFLARDRLGVKPLFYTLQNEALVFGSEPKALFAHPRIKPKITLESLREVFAVGPARTSGCGVFSGVFELKPGTTAVFDRSGFRSSRYWELESRPHTSGYEETREHVSWLVRDAVTRQMVSDVPVCSFLSGGIDSSIVTAVASGYLAEKGGRMNTFSFDFKGNDRYFQSSSFQPRRDRPFVEEMLAEYPLNHSFLECSETELADLLYESTKAKDLPGMADVDASLLYFCSVVGQHNKVVLTGECADEIFGGYPWFYREALLNTDGFPWSNDYRARAVLLKDELVNKLNMKEYAYEKYRETLAAVPRLEGEDTQNARRREITYLNIVWFMQTLLTRMDRTSMYSGLEARVPFADHRIAEYLWNVPWEYKMQNGIEKKLLRDACANLLPDGILNRKKSPYPKTYNPNYERLLKEKLLALINGKTAPILELIDEKKARSFLETPSEYGKPW
ncbi:MAG: asparagine synthase (glutamine-hydrolyzing), partial [Oscillospiraceae bacterium]|nr:asparagine synthase (glutamine-hydrolyzing) [Oscillospiraceae bacterium]